MSTVFATRRASHELFRKTLQLHRCMSVRPAEKDTTAPVPRKKVTIQTLHALRQSKTPIAMMTAYDYPSAVASSSSPLTDITLVGDSLAQVCLGYASTTQLTMTDMIHHAQAVGRGTTHPFLVVDMPYGSYHTSVSDAVANAIRLVREGGAEGLKLEGGKEIADIVRRLTEVGVPVMAHIGLLPQRHCALSGYKVQGKSAEGARRLLADALALEEAGAFAMVVEAVPQEVGKYITDRLRIPTIGIGAGPHTSGQVLVYDDLLGTWSGHKAKFVRRFGNLKDVRDQAIRTYGEAIKNGTFPDPQAESYTMDKDEWERFIESDGGQLVKY